MNTSIQSALNNQANHELFAAHSYLAMAMWCEEKSYAGFAKFFYKQGQEEHAHASRFFKHLLDRGVLPEVSAVEAPRLNFERLRDVADHAQALERRNSENIHQCYDIAIEVKDFASQPMLLTFIEEQVEEEGWADSMVTLTRRAECSGATYNLDRHIVKELEGGGIEE